jgi:hypothetical protein
LKPLPVRLEMSLERPIANSTRISAKPTMPARSIVWKEMRRPRTFSASAQKTWPPSRGKNGNRLTIASESEISASVPSASTVEKENSCEVIAIGEVDRERRRSESHPRQVADVELGAV